MAKKNLKTLKNKKKIIILRREKIIILRKEKRIKVVRVRK